MIDILPSLSHSPSLHKTMPYDIELKKKKKNGTIQSFRESGGEEVGLLFPRQVPAV